MIELLWVALAHADSPRPVDVPPIAGDVTREVDGLEGLRIVVGAEATQVVSWGPVDGSLVDDARHELDLVRMSIGLPDLAPTRFEGAAVNGLPAIAWETEVGHTLFLGAVFDCPRARVAVVTSGHGERVRELHIGALAGTVCVRQGAGT